MELIKVIEGLPSKKFRTVLDKAHQITIIAHTDMDGMAAVKSLTESKYSEKIQNIFFTDNHDRSIKECEVLQILGSDTDLVLFLDISVSNYDQLNRILAGRRGYILDHHREKAYDTVKNLSTEFHASGLFTNQPDSYSIAFLSPCLLGSKITPDFVISGLIGDNNMKFFQEYFSFSQEEFGKAAKLAAIYKRLGGLVCTAPDVTGVCDTVRNNLSLTLRLARDITDLHDRLLSNEFIIKTLDKIDRDYLLLKEGALKEIEKNKDQNFLTYEFWPESGFVVGGFIYQLEKSVKEAFPSFKGFLNVAQECETYWQCDGLSTAPDEIHAGQLLSPIGGGHGNAGGGGIEKEWDITPHDWLMQRAKEFSL